MLPPFDDYGNLPPGIHRCTKEEMAERFGTGSDERVSQFKELLDFIDYAKAAGIVRLLVNGSFVTGKLSPNDVDVVILPGPNYYQKVPDADDERWQWPFLQIMVALSDEDFESWAAEDFA